MPTDESPNDVNEPESPLGAASESPDSGEPSRPAATAGLRGSRWVDYDTHELLEMISELEDERRWSRFREGIWLAILIHAALFAAIMLLPKYVFKVPVVVDKSATLDHKEFTYMDTPRFQPKVTVKPVPIKPPQIDRQTLEEMNRANPPAPVQAPAPVAPPPIPPSQQTPSPVERLVRRPFLRGPTLARCRIILLTSCATPCEAPRDLPAWAQGIYPPAAGCRCIPVLVPAHPIFCRTRRAWTSTAGCNAGIGRRSGTGIR